MGSFHFRFVLRYTVVKIELPFRNFVPDKTCVCCRLYPASVLRSCIVGPYVPLREIPSESASAIRYAGLKAKEHNSEMGEIES